ncbi:NlpC/P60 family protein [Prauserella shujinwangii]|uniref:NlpC/P60 family protein n=1 Tax=Prauserella shujinwangii TaxID=1453103 RepID=A0A2T0LXP0_9PSEU|nr:NlpC/P60 family protein [Prauserella shujinwangii]
MLTSTSSRSGRRRVASAAAGTALTAATLLGSPGTGSAVLTARQTLADVPTTVEQGTKVTFSGDLTGLVDRPLTRQRVDLQWRSGPGQPWRTSAHDTTDADGEVAVRAAVTRDAQWRLRFPGNQVYDPAASRAVAVDAKEPPPPPPPEPKPQPKPEPEQAAPVGRRIVEVAASLAGTPYRYGAEGPGSFDCSGFTRYVHRQVGIALPRTSSQQRAAVPHLAKHAKRPGDLVFFHDGGSVYHVGIYAGGNQIWAAPEPGDVVRRQDIWTSAYTVGRAW